MLPVGSTSTTVHVWDEGGFKKQRTVLQVKPIVADQKQEEEKTVGDVAFYRVPVVRLGW